MIWIVLVNYNGNKVTRECLDSLAKVKTPAFRVVLVDNGSLPSAQFGVETIYLPKNLGYPAAANRGIAYALERGASYILLLNNDTEVSPDFLKELDPTSSAYLADIVAPVIYYHGTNLIWSMGGKISYWRGEALHAGIRTSEPKSSAREWASGCCLLIAREVFETIGLLNEAGMYGEDVDFCLRARKSGFSLWVESKARITHKVSVDMGGHLSFNKNMRKLAGNYRLFARHSKPWHWLTWPWMLPLTALYRLAMYQFETKINPTLDTIIDGWLNE